MNLNRETLKEMILEAIDEIAADNTKTENKGMTKSGVLPSQQAAAAEKVSNVKLKGAGAAPAELVVKKMMAGGDVSKQLMALKGRDSEAKQVIAALARYLGIDLAAQGVKVSNIAKGVELSEGM